ncbi:MAG: hypothetical protein K2X09_03730 [Rickettsiales bacterium]|nr:hypothetical protein [Rickettsiales bacterium]
MQVLGNKQESRTNHDGTITVHIPVSFQKRGGRKYIIAPDAIPEEYRPPKESSSILKAIAQAFYWREMIESGEVISVTDLARKIDMNESYLARVLRLSLLAPDIIRALVEGRQPRTLTLLELFKPIPLDWNEQRERYGFTMP